MSSRVFIAKPPNLSELESFSAELVLSGNSLGPPLQTLKAKCRELARAESALLISPTPQSLSHPFGQLSLWIVAKKDAISGPKVRARLHQLNIKISHRVPVTHSVVQTCYHFTVIARLAPKWNLLTHWLIKGSDFLTTGKAQAINFEIGMSEREITVNIEVSKLSFSPLKPEDLRPTTTVLQSFRSNPDYVIQESSIYSNRCILLPNFSSGYIFSASHHFPSSPSFPSYDTVRLHWKKQHGMVLPEKQDLFYQVFFKMNSKNFFSYPGCCVFKTHPTSFPSREADTVTTAFIADLHARVPTVCGTTVRYSNRAHTPLAVLEPAIGCMVETNRHTNLKPVKLVPQLDSNRFPIPPSMCLPRHVAALPTESAARQPPCEAKQPAKNFSQTGFSQYSQSQQNRTDSPLNMNQSSRYCVESGTAVRQKSDHETIVPQLYPSTLPRTTVHGNAVKDGVGHHASLSGSLVARVTGSTHPKVVPQFGRRGGVAQQSMQGSRLTMNVKKQISTVNGRGAPCNHTSSIGQPPPKKSRLSLPASISLGTKPTTGGRPLTETSRHTATLTQGGQNLTGDRRNGGLDTVVNSGGAQSVTHQQNLHSSSQQRLAVSQQPSAFVSSSMNEQEQLVRKYVEHGKEKNLARDMDQSGTAKEKVKVHVHPKGPVQVDGVSNDVIKKISKCKVSLLKKWLQENGVKCRSKDKKDDLTRLVAVHLQQTGKTFHV